MTTTIIPSSDLPSSRVICTERDLISPMNPRPFGVKTPSNIMPSPTHDPILSVAIDGNLLSSVFPSLISLLRNPSRPFISAPIHDTDFHPSLNSPPSPNMTNIPFSSAKVLSSEVDLLIPVQGSEAPSFVGSPRWFSLFGTTDDDPSVIVEDLYAGGIAKHLSSFAGRREYHKLCEDGSSLTCDEIMTIFERLLDDFKARYIEFTGFFVRLTVYPVNISSSEQSIEISRRLAAYLSEMSNGAILPAKPSPEMKHGNMPSVSAIDGCTILGAKLRR